jgi:triacylglycerol lipase
VSVEANARAIRDIILQISQEGKKILIFGHSKGSVDAAAAIAIYGLYEHICAFLSVQAPYGGTPIADVIEGDSKLSSVASSTIQSLFKGDLSAVLDLSYSNRRKFLSAHPFDTKRFPTISFVTTCHASQSMMSPMVHYIRTRHSLLSDGCVPKDDAIIPGSDIIFVKGKNHLPSNLFCCSILLEVWIMETLYFQHRSCPTWKAPQ